MFSLKSAKGLYIFDVCKKIFGRNKMLGKIALILTIIGGINWGLVGVADFNLVNFILGFAPILERIVYILVGLSAIYAAYDSFKK